MTDVSKYKSLATDIEDYKIIAEIRSHRIACKTIIKQCIALGKDAWLKTGTMIARENPNDKKNLVPFVSFVLVKDIPYLVGERVVMPCDCYDPKIKLKNLALMIKIAL